MFFVFLLPCFDVPEDSACCAHKHLFSFSFIWSSSRDRNEKYQHRNTIRVFFTCTIKFSSVKFRYVSNMTVKLELGF